MPGERCEGTVIISHQVWLDTSFQVPFYHQLALVNVCCTVGIKIEEKKHE